MKYLVTLLGCLFFGASAIYGQHMVEDDTQIKPVDIIIVDLSGKDDPDVTQDDPIEIIELNDGETDTDTGEEIINELNAYQPIELGGITYFEKFDLYPNPVHNELFIELDSFNMAEVEIIELTGKIIHNEIFENTNLISIDVSSIQSGLYVIQVRQNDNAYARKLQVR